jgi:glycosyltransferase involved in cell wall biosynthesis
MSPTQKPILTVVLPCYNEADNIPLILDRFHLAATRDDVKLLLVNNGSTDQTERVLSEYLPNHSFASTIRVPVNQGYGFGILQGLGHCTTEYLGWTHADMQTDPKDIFKALGLIEQNQFRKDIYIKGRRKGRSLSDEFFTTGMSLFESCYLGAKLWDINAQPNIFHRSFFESWQSPPTDFSLDLYAYYTAVRSGLNIVRFEVQFPERLHGHSKWNTGLNSKLRFIKRTLEFSIKLKESLKQQANKTG